MYGDYRRGGSVFGAFLLGGLFGAVLGLLFAPRSGKETRDMMSDRANEYWGQAGEMYESGKTKVGEAVTTGQQAVADQSEALRAKIDEARGRLQDQVAKTASTAKDKVADVTPAVHDVVDKAAGKTQDSLDFVAKKASGTVDAAAEGADAVAEGVSDVSTEIPEI